MIDTLINSFLLLINHNYFIAACSFRDYAWRSLASENLFCPLVNTYFNNELSSPNALLKQIASVK